MLPGVLGAFRQRYPAVEVTLTFGNSKQILAAVRAGEFDLAVVGHRDTNPAEASLATCVEDELVLVVGPTHAWACRHHIAPAELARQPLLLREPGSATRLVTERALTSAGVAYRPGMVLPHTEAIKQGVMAGLGVAFVSVYALQEEQVTGRLRPLRVRGLRIVRTFHLIHHERRLLSTAGRAFTELFATSGAQRNVGLDRPGHNLYIQVAVEAGLFGLALLGFAFASEWLALRSTGALAPALAAALVALLVVDAFESFIWFKYFWLLFMVIRMAERRSLPRSSTSPRPAREDQFVLVGSVKS